ncbi:MAG: ribosome silencing factor [Phycisphaerales bacterium]
MDIHENDQNKSPDKSQDKSATGGAGSRPGATLSGGAKILDTESAKEFAVLAAQSLVDDKCTDVVVLDVGGISPVTGFIVIGSGTSARQMRSALQTLEEVAQECGTSAFHISEDNDSIWLLADFVDVVVHLFEPNARAHYDLEGLWGEGVSVEVPPSERARRGGVAGGEG